MEFKLSEAGEQVLHKVRTGQTVTTEDVSKLSELEQGCFVRAMRKLYP